jgi:SAM-dependent methyltransferase
VWRLSASLAEAHYGTGGRKFCHGTEVADNPLFEADEGIGKGMIHVAVIQRGQLIPFGYEDALFAEAYQAFFERRAVEGDHVMAGRLRCRVRPATSPIDGGIPFLVEECNVEPNNRRTAERFGFEWDTFDFLTPSYEAEFLDWIAPVRREFFAGKTTLDAGCGQGRHAVLFARLGAREVFGIDLAAGSVKTALRNTWVLANVYIVRVDIGNPPVRDGTLDYVYSIGVLIYTPDSHRSFRCLAQKVAEGATISVWVYGREGNKWLISFVNPFRTTMTARLPLDVTKAIASRLAMLLQPILKIVHRLTNDFRALRPFRRMPFGKDYPYYVSAVSFRENYSIVFDHLLPQTARYIPRAEVLAWFERAMLENVIIARRTNNSWRGKGQKV